MANNTNKLNSMLCKSNCGFFGNASCDGFCSKCYKDHVKRQNSGSVAGRVTPTTGLSSSSTTATTNIVAAAAAAAAIAMETTSQTILQINNMNEIPVKASSNQSETGDTSSNQMITSQDASIASCNKMLPPQSPPPVVFSLNSEDIADPGTKPSSSNPIPIPSRKTSASDANKLTHRLDHSTMSVPADLCSTSLLSMTSASPTGTIGEDSLLATSIGDMNSVNSNSVSSMPGNGGEKKKRTRCVLASCKRKVGLTGFDCRCGGLYCWEHRYSDKHNCQFDYKELGQDQIRKNNPIVVGEKIQKI